MKKLKPRDIKAGESVRIVLRRFAIYHGAGDVSLQNNDLDRAFRKVKTGREVPLEAGDLSNRSSAPGCPAGLP